MTSLFSSILKNTRIMFLFSPLAIIWILLTTSDLVAKDFYLDPINGRLEGDGSLNKPFPSLEEVIKNNLIEGKQCESLPYKPDCNMVVKNPGAPIKGGDRLLLMNGYHGSITLMDLYEDTPIIVEALSGHQPKIKNIRCLGASRWVFRGLYISPSFEEPYQKVDTLVVFENHNWRGPCKDTTIENSTIFSVWDSSNWTIDDWNNLSCSGISVQTENCVVRNNYLKNVNFGISVSGKYAKVQNNAIENFAGDGLRGIGDYGLFEYNLVKNCYDVNQNHDDGFQSWSVGSDGKVGTGEVVGVVLRGNMIINYTDPNQPFRGTLQGIGCFDGFYRDWVVENNVIITDHWHGITFSGARNVRIINNTVVDINQESPGPAWIMIGNHKDGTPSENCIIRNNIAMKISSGPETIADHNLIIDFDWAKKYFIDYSSFDLHLTADSPAIDMGSEEFAPPIDRDGVKRPQGNGIDLGAYEFTNAQLDAGQTTDTTEDIEQNNDALSDTQTGNDITGADNPTEEDGITYDITTDIISSDDTPVSGDTSKPEDAVSPTDTGNFDIHTSDNLFEDNNGSTGCSCSTIF